LISRFIPKGKSIDDIDETIIAMWRTGAIRSSERYWAIDHQMMFTEEYHSSNQSGVLEEFCPFREVKICS